MRLGQRERERGRRPTDNSILGGRKKEIDSEEERERDR